MYENANCVKENPNPAKAKELVNVILNCNISDQNEIIDMMRRQLVEARNEYIADLQTSAKNLSEQIDYAESSLQTIIIGELKN